ncbi:hypothetical protein RRG08_012287 [Elysia crispata]|uniref:Uncharacterized protein n=1 Tax=Elysia crispata TaxID=231223 RepID=A0AAE1BAZ3_9GAST|nr:hypothetical protein RRG08_012287 [Elysia crispata]
MFSYLSRAKLVRLFTWPYLYRTGSDKTSANSHVPEIDEGRLIKLDQSMSLRGSDRAGDSTYQLLDKRCLSSQILKQQNRGAFTC